MGKDKLHPSVKKFKQFVVNHPHVLEEVKRGEKTLQELFEEWYILGEDDPKWNVNHQSEKKSKDESNDDGKLNDIIGSVLSAVKNIDIQQLQKHIGTAQQFITSLQEIIQQFQGNQQTSNKNSHPLFSFRKD